jgi:hypothetical protein
MSFVSQRYVAIYNEQEYSIVIERFYNTFNYSACCRLYFGCFRYLTGIFLDNAFSAIYETMMRISLGQFVTFLCFYRYVFNNKIYVFNYIIFR